MTKAQILEQFDEFVGVPKGYFGSIETAIARQECDHLYEQVGAGLAVPQMADPSEPDKEVRYWQCRYCGNKFSEVVDVNSF